MIYWVEQEGEFFETRPDPWEPHYIYAGHWVKQKFRWLEMDGPTQVRVPKWGGQVATVVSLEWDDNGEHQHLVLDSGVKLHLGDVEFGRDDV